MYQNNFYQFPNQPPAAPRSSGRRPRRYGLLKFIFDVILVLLTQGLWLIWIFVREMRYRR